MQSGQAPIATQSPVRRRPLPSKSISSISTTESFAQMNVNFSQELEPTRVTSPHFKGFEEESLIPIESDPCISPNTSSERSETIEDAVFSFGLPHSTSHMLSRAGLQPLPSIDSPFDSDTDEHVAPRLPRPTKPRSKAFARLKPKHSHHLSSITSTLNSLSFGHRVRHVSSDSSVFCLENVMEGHRNTITGLVRQGNLVISSSADYTLKLWDIRNSGIKTRVCSQFSTLAHKGKVTGLVSISPSLLASTGALRCALWRVEERRLKKEAGFQVGAVTCISSPSPLTLLMGYSSGEASIWSLETAQATASFPGHSSRLNQLCPFAPGCFVTASSDTFVKLWDFRSGKCSSTLAGHKDSVTSLLPMDDYSFMSGSVDCSIKVRTM